MTNNHVKDISRIYLEQVAAVDEGVRPGNVETPLNKANFKKRRKSLAGKEASAEARKRGHEGKTWADSGRTYSPDEAKSRRKNMSDTHRSLSYGTAENPDDNEGYPAVKTKNPKKLRKQKAMGELGEASHLETNMKKRAKDNEKAREDIKKTKAHKEMAAAAAKKFDEALDPVGKEDSDSYLKNRRKVRSRVIAKEGFSNWREDLVEVADKIKTNKSEEPKIVEKSVNNKININPKLNLGETIEELGGELLEMVEIENFEGVLDELTESEIFLLSDQLIEQVVEEFFYECIQEGYDILEVENELLESLEISSSLLTEEESIKESKLEKIKGAVKRVGKALARGVGYAAGAAVRGVKAAGREMKSGYKRGRSGSSLSTKKEPSAPSSSSSDNGDSGEKKPGLLSRIGSKLKRGLAKAARAVSRGARNVARKMEGGETKKAESPKAAPKKVEKPEDPWAGSATTPAKPKAKTKKAAAPKAKAPAAAKPVAKKKKTSKLDDLLASVRSEEAQLDEKTLSDAEKEKKEEIFKSLKRKRKDFESRYPGRGEDVMHGVATKMAKKLA